MTTNIIDFNNDASSECSSEHSAVSEFSEKGKVYRFLSYERITGYRRNSNLLYTIDEKQFYVYNSTNSNGDAFKCRECNSRVHVRADKMCIQQEKYFVHNHTTREQVYTELKVLNIAKQKCADISTLINERKQSIRDIFYSVLSDYPDVQINFYSIERSLQIIRNSAMPKNPLNCDEISKMFERDDIMQMLGRTSANKTFYNGCMESSEYGFCAFSSVKSIDLFKSRTSYGQRTIMIDGTFDVVPIGPFNQLLVIYGVYIEKVSRRI